MITRRAILGATPAALATPAVALADGAAITDTLTLLDAQAHLRTGSAGDAAVADFVRARLQTAGFRVSLQRVDAPAFESGRAAVAWEGGELAVEPQAPVRVTGPDGVRGPLRLWRDRTDTADMAGAVAVVMLPPGRHSQLLAAPIRSILTAVAEAGARAIVFVTDGPTGETVFLNAPINPDAAPAIPLAVIGPRPGASLIAAAREQRQATFILDGVLRRVRSANLIGRMNRRGPCLVVSTPRTGWTPAVAERGPGLAAFLALAQWAPTALPNHALTLVCTTAHEYDNAGSHAFFDDGAPSPDQTALWVHLGAGFAARDFHEVGRYALAPLPSPDAQRYLMGSDPLAPMLRHTFAGQVGLEAAYPTSAGPAAGELYEVYSRGYAPVFGLFAAHRFHHVMQDRLDKTDPAWIQAATDAVKASILAALT